MTHSSLVRERRAQQAKALAYSLGFDACGIARPVLLAQEARHMGRWLGRRHHGSMRYMERYFEQRIDPCKVLPGARSVVVMLYNYAPPKDIFRDRDLKIAKYAYGRDYHHVLKKKLKRFIDGLRQLVGGIEGRSFVDSSPVMETVWASRAGLGWKGKNSLLINKKRGSFFFICGILTDLPMQADAPVTDHCGSCTRCIDHCPTDAILPNRSVDATRCISYLTIESRTDIPRTFADKMNGWTFGCDICQDVCPWNRFASPHSEPDFSPKEAMARMRTEDWYALSRAGFERLFRGSAVKRAKYAGLMRNIHFIQANRTR